MKHRTDARPSATAAIVAGGRDGKAGNGAVRPSRRRPLGAMVTAAAVAVAFAVSAFPFVGPHLPAPAAMVDEAGGRGERCRERDVGDAGGRDEIWAVTFGGRLYDDWMAVLGAEPPGRDHPAYPAAGRQTGVATWRCKECHGWDYKGAQGTYRKGPHYTGIKGVRGVAGLSPTRIEAMIVNGSHGFDRDMIPPEALAQLALFLSRGQIDMDRYIDPATAVAAGDPRRGAALYQTICANCHGRDGRAINFHSEGPPEFVGTEAAKNPWETLHKIRNGQPGAPMVSLGALSLCDQIDTLAYAQTLPTD